MTLIQLRDILDLMIAEGVDPQSTIMLDDEGMQYWECTKVEDGKFSDKPVVNLN